MSEIEPEDDEGGAGDLLVPLQQALTGAAPLEPAAVNEGALAALPRNDLGNAARLRARHGADLRFVKEFAREARAGWLVWQENAAGGGTWARDAWPEAVQLAHRTAEAIGDEARALYRLHREDYAAERTVKGKDEIAKRWGDHHKWSVQTGNHGRIEAMLATAAPYLMVRQDQLDADPFAFAAANGVLRLPPRDQPTVGDDGGGEDSAEASLEPARRGDLITKASPVAWDPAADAPRFRAFLATILPDPELRAFLQRWFGYCLTALTVEQVVVMFYGTGGNGKSTLLNIIKGVMGGYAVQLPFESFVSTEKTGGQPTPDIVRLPGARLMTASEPEVGVKLSEAVIKAHTGGETVAVRPLYQAQFEFLPSHKSVLSFNVKPKIVGQDEGIWRRIILVPFEVRLAGRKAARPFDAEILAEEGPGVLRWLVDGYLAWRERGLDPPDSVRDATGGYRAEGNVLADFLESCTLPDPAGRVQAAELYSQYQRWCRVNAVDPISSTRFGKEMPERGFAKAKVHGLIYYSGLVLNGEAVERVTEALRGDQETVL